MTLPGQWIQCVPNFSEGRDPGVLRALAEAAARPGVRLVDGSADPDHHRSVFTLLGDAAALRDSVQAMAGVAVDRIDLRRHRGVHPRAGAIDVVPFVPFGATSLESCATLAREVAACLADQFGLPAYLYGTAATRSEREGLPFVRNRGFEALAGAPLVGEVSPDFGPSRVHPSAGVVMVGARGPLLAFNVNLRSADPAVAQRVARQIRESSGGLPGVRALGFALPEQGCVQVSMNLTRPEETGMAEAYARIATLAAAEGVEILGSELIGALRLQDTLPVARYFLKMTDLTGDRVLEMAAADLAGDTSEN